MKRTILLAAVLALCVGSARASSSVQPVAKCRISAARVASGAAVAQGVCMRGGKRVPASWNYVVTIRDATGSLCGLTPNKGTARSFHFVPPDPRQTTVTFRLKAKSGHTRTVSKTVRRSNADSLSVCSYQPKITSIPSGTSLGCSWNSPPVSSGLVFKTTDMTCEGVGTCKWSIMKPLHYVQPNLTLALDLWGVGKVTCDSGATANTLVTLHLGAGGDGGWSCAPVVAYATSFALPPVWGGSFNWEPWVVTKIPHHAPVFSHPENGPYTQWQPLSGDQNPCPTTG